MNQKLPNLLILTLAYPPASGGASIYTQLLTEGLLEQGFLGKIFVLAESYPNLPKQEILYSQKLYLLRYFPFRSEMSRSNPTRYFKYFYQNLQFLILIYWLRKFKITHFMIHCHYYYSPSILPLIIWLIKQLTPVKLILDIRDPKFSQKPLSQLKIYSKIICCSQNIYENFAKDINLLPQLNLIPIPFKFLPISSKTIDYYLNKYQLKNQPYLFCASGFLKEKNIDFTLKVMQELKKLDSSLILVLVGAKKDWDLSYEEATTTGLLKYLGILPHEAIFALASKAKIVINFSQIESPSRYILEAISVKAKVLLPPNIPEFVASDPDKILQSNHPKIVAQQIITLLQKTNYQLNYNLEIHSLENVIPQYLKLLS